MLQHLGNVFFKVQVIDRKSEVPTIYLDLYRRDNKQFLGQMRFNHDPLYSKKSNEIRMAFDVFDPHELDPSTSSLLEDIIVGGFIWITRDNHYTYSFHPRPYMTVHDYQEDSDLMRMINAATRNILVNLGCEVGGADQNMFIFSKEITSQYLSEKLAKG